ncbi:MAG TPA: M43 family zinc metalloprotease, partial [Bacteroidia bacterium]|nr:M43 family zinc metalloprotease [Bacteroidia bacterium]
KTGQVRIIPVVVHVFHKAGGENISDAQIQRELDNLNKTFRGQFINASRPRPEFQGVVADMEIELRLARKDPQGNCTNGIVRIYDEETENGTNNIKIKSVWPTDRYLNVWIVEKIVNYSALPGIAGYAQFPWAGSYNTDGVIIINDQIGDIGTSNPGNATTVTHEIGHWLGLFHTFQDSCQGGDKVDDTPPAADIRTGILSCDHNRNTCSNDHPNLPDQIENFMDYTIGTCQNMFTIGQKARMDATMEKWRPYMWTIENLIATGTDVPNQTANCAPIADFFAMDNQRARNQFACAGGTGVDFRDNSFNYNGTITREWIFEGGTPATSTSQNPKVSYATPGKYDVTLIVSNANGSDTMYMNDYIEVGPAQAAITGGYTQDFEFPVFPTDGWYTNSTTFIDFDITDVGIGTAIEGNSKVLRAQNGGSISGAKFDLFTPSINLSGLSSPVLSYYYAFAQRLVNGSLSNDEFRIFYSLDCGQTWVNLTAPRVGTVLNTVGTQTPIAQLSFVPSDRSKWRQVVVPIPGSITAAQRQNIRFKFQFISKGGNNFYIDAINFGFPASVQDTYFESEENFNVYPNPTAGAATVNVNLINESQVKITVMDMLGRTVATVADGTYQGTQVFAFDTDNYTATGLYFVKMDIDGRSYTRKLVVE